MKKFYSLLIALSIFLGLNAQNPAYLDTSFGTGGYAVNAIAGGHDEAESMAIQADGKILVAGDAQVDNKFNFAVTRFNTNGTVDNSFGTDGSAYLQFATQSFGKAVAVQADGKIVLSGYVFHEGGYKAAVVRFTESGELDSTFGDDGKQIFPGLNNTETCALQEDGKIVIAGYKDDKFGIARVNTDGTIDTSFGDDGYKVTPVPNYGFSYILNIGIQSDGKIVGAGMGVGNEGYDIIVGRYNSDGTLDTGFATNGFFSEDLSGEYSADFGTGVVFQADGKIVISGHLEYSLLPGVAEYDATVLRLNEDGSYDTSFGTNGKAVLRLNDEATYVGGVTLQADEKILITGKFVDTTDGIYDIYVARINTDGSVDTSFGNDGHIIYSPNQTDADAQSILVQNDGRILVAGWVVSDQDVKNYMVMRLIGEYDMDEEPSVEVTASNIKPTSFDVSFVPNLACDKYHFVALTTEDLEFWLPVMFEDDTIALVKAWGIEKNSSYTHSYTEMTPGTDYFIYTVCVGLDESEVLISPTLVTTTTAGGTGIAELTIEITEITDTTARVIVTPNAETAEFHAGLMTKEYFEEIGEEAAINYFKEDGWPLYETDDWVWPELLSDTEYKAIAVGKNALGEWGPATIKDFKTLGGTTVDTQSLNSLAVYPNPGNGFINIEINGANNAQIQVLDMTGRVVYSNILNSTSTSVDISHVNSGMYIIRVENSGHVSTTKYVKQ